MNNVTFHPLEEITSAVASAAIAVELFDEDFQPEIRPADPRFGDFQANGILPFSKKKKLNPRDAASKLVDYMTETKSLDQNCFELEISGPGFINFRMTQSYLKSWLNTFANKSALQKAAGNILRGHRFVVDFSSPNTAKELSVAIIRTTGLGEAICRILTFCGGRVIRDNHIGDWGTQFGVLIMAIKQAHPGPNHLEGATITDIEHLYVEGNKRAKADPAAMNLAREERSKLQNGDPENLKLWEKINTISYASFQEIYDRLNIRFDLVQGESFYRNKSKFVYKELSQLGIAEESEGALVVFHPEHPRFKDQPAIIRFSDGSSNYQTSDLATIHHRVEEFKPDEIIYVTDSRQIDHFEQLFLTSQKWFAAKNKKLPKLVHANFGTILGENGKAMRTRDGAPMKLKDLLDEAIERAFKVVTEKNPDLSEDERRNIGRVVGLGAVRYSDLMQNRTSDYIFSWNKMLSLEGNTAPYLLYAVARLYSIFRRAGVEASHFDGKIDSLKTETEIQLARKLIGFVAALEQTLADYRPHFLTTYLYELAGIFSTFYKTDKVLDSHPEIRSRRLALCAMTLNTLETGLHLLGLETLEQM